MKKFYIQLSSCGRILFEEEVSEAKFYEAKSQWRGHAISDFEVTSKYIKMSTFNRAEYLKFTNHTNEVLDINMY